MKEGIKAQQRIWTNLKIKKSDEKHEEVQSALSPNQKKTILMARTKLEEDLTKSLDELIVAMDITD